MDEQYGDIYTSINDREIEIIQSMLAKVSEFNTVIIQVGEAAVELIVYAVYQKCPNLGTIRFLV